MKTKTKSNIQLVLIFLAVVAALFGAMALGYQGGLSDAAQKEVKFKAEMDTKKHKQVFPTSPNRQMKSKQYET